MRRRVLLAEHGGDMAALKKAEPWLFVDVPSGGASALDDPPPTISVVARWLWAAGRGKKVFRLWRWLTFFARLELRPVIFAIAYL